MYTKVQIHHVNPHLLWHMEEYVPHPTLANLLSARDRLIIISHGSPPYRVVLGVPHHTAGGVWQICEQRRDKHGHIKPRPGDDNVALYALAAFSALKARNIPGKLVIMAHATTHDPNKLPDSPYCQEIFSQETVLLFECHAAGPRRRLDLELSAGSNP